MHQRHNALVDNYSLSPLNPSPKLLRPARPKQSAGSKAAWPRRAPPLGSAGSCGHRPPQGTGPPQSPRGPDAGRPGNGPFPAGCPAPSSPSLPRPRTPSRPGRDRHRGGRHRPGRGEAAEAPRRLSHLGRAAAAAERGGTRGLNGGGSCRAGPADPRRRRGGGGGGARPVGGRRPLPCGRAAGRRSGQGRAGCSAVSVGGCRSPGGVPGARPTPRDNKHPPAPRA